MLKYIDYSELPESYYDLVIGCVVSMKNGSYIRIRGFQNSSTISIEILGTDEGRTTTYQAIKQGYVDNANKTLANGGVVGVRFKGQRPHSFEIWNGMMGRCYLKKKCNTNASYFNNVIVDEDWKFYPNFKEWFDKNYVKGWDLDKDILSYGLGIYSPENCCFIPTKINNFLNFNKGKRSKLALGVSKGGRSTTYTMRLSVGGQMKVYSGFKTLQEATSAYFEKKLEFLREMVEESAEAINPAVLEHLRSINSEDLKIYAGQSDTVTDQCALGRYNTVLERVLTKELPRNNIMLQENIKLSKILKDHNLYHLLLEE